MTAPSGQGLNAKQLAQSMHDYVISAYSVASDTAPLPAHRVIAAGLMQLTAWDCAQFSVGLTGIDIDVPEQTPTRPGLLKATALRHVALTAQIIRCTAPMRGTQPPTAEAITEVGLQAMRDAGLLSQALFEWATRAQANDDAVLVAGVGAVLPVGPQGNLVGVEATVVITAELV